MMPSGYCWKIPDGLRSCLLLMMCFPNTFEELDLWFDLLFFSSNIVLIHVSVLLVHFHALWSFGENPFMHLKMFWILLIFISSSFSDLVWLLKTYWVWNKANKVYIKMYFCCAAETWFWNAVFVGGGRPLLKQWSSSSRESYWGI